MSRGGDPYDNIMEEDLIYPQNRIYLPEQTCYVSKSHEMTEQYIYFYNHESIQLKNGKVPLTLRYSP